MTYYCFKPKKKLALWKKILIWLLLIIFVLCFFLFTVINPVVYEASDTYLRAVAMNEINQAVFETFDSSIKYEDLIQFERNTQNEIVFARVNSLLINKLASDICGNAQNNITIIGNRGMFVPLGTFSGIIFFSGKGPNVNIKFLPYGYTDAKFFSSFESVGINQTLHRIIINIVSDICIYLPLQVKKSQVIVDVLVCENLIVGKVPENLLDIFGNK